MRVCQLFFGLMALAMVGVRYKSDKRDQYLQHGGWFVKIALWLLFNVLAFFLPVGMVNAYGAGAQPLAASQLQSFSFICSQRLHCWPLCLFGTCLGTWQRAGGPLLGVWQTADGLLQ